MQRIDLLWSRNRQPSKQNSMQQLKNRKICSDADSESQHHCQRKPRHFPDLPNCVSQLANKNGSLLGRRRKSHSLHEMSAGHHLMEPVYIYLLWVLKKSRQLAG